MNTNSFDGLIKCRIRAIVDNYVCDHVGYDITKQVRLKTHDPIFDKMSNEVWHVVWLQVREEIDER